MPQHQEPLVLIHLNMLNPWLWCVSIWRNLGCGLPQYGEPSAVVCLNMRVDTFGSKHGLVSCFMALLKLPFSNFDCYFFIYGPSRLTLIFLLNLFDAIIDLLFIARQLRSKKVSDLKRDFDHVNLGLLKSSCHGLLYEGLPILDCRP